MDDQGLTQDQLSDLAKMPRQTISAVLNQRNEPSEETLAKLALALGLEAPRIERVLVLRGKERGPVAMIREAQAILEEAAKLIDPRTREMEALVEQDEQNLGRGRSADAERKRKKG